VPLSFSEKKLFIRRQRDGFQIKKMTRCRKDSNLTAKISGNDCSKSLKGRLASGIEKKYS